MNSASPRVFAQRCIWFFLAVLLAQFFHLNVIASATIEHNMVWLCVALGGVGLMALILRNINVATAWPEINSELFLLLFLASFFVVVVFSRAPYIYSFINHGLYLTREGGEVGNGGWYSLITVIFYPLCIVLAFVEISRKKYYVLVAMMWCVVLLDFFILGTRNAPTFVLLFHLLTSRVKFFSPKMIVFVVGSITLFVLLFDWQSKARSLDTVTVGWSWSETLRYSWLMEHLSIKEENIRFFDENLSLVMPAVFLLQYISHSIAVFSDLISAGQYDAFGWQAYLYDQYAIVGGGRDYTSELIQNINPDAGLYQTLYSSLLFDFGWIGVFLMIVVLMVAYGFFDARRATISPISIYLLMVLSTSSIENYLYNGLGLWRFLVFLLMVSLLSRVPKKMFETLVHNRRLGCQGSME